ncbi:hypothetical protein HRbin03_00023 [archaeon HR03]|nr:hypothetical protein HRbin03_00023 [archaeon HR03]
MRRLPLWSIIIAIVSIGFALLALFMPTFLLHTIAGTIFTHEIIESSFSVALLLVCTVFFFTAYKPWKKIVATILSLTSLAIPFIVFHQLTNRLREIAKPVEAYFTFGPGASSLFLAGILMLVASLLWRKKK